MAAQLYGGDNEDGEQHEHNNIMIQMPLKQKLLEKITLLLCFWRG